jgi:hypothetical protein
MTATQSAGNASGFSRPAGNLVDARLETWFPSVMTTKTCTKCNDTGYLYRRFYTAPRHCSCPTGVEAASWDNLTTDERNARATAQGEALRATAIEARHARRAAREAAL